MDYIEFKIQFIVKVEFRYAVLSRWIQDLQVCINSVLKISNIPMRDTLTQYFTLGLSLTSFYWEVFKCTAVGCGSYALMRRLGASAEVVQVRKFHTCAEVPYLSITALLRGEDYIYLPPLLPTDIIQLILTKLKTSNPSSIQSSSPLPPLILGVI